MEIKIAHIQEKVESISDQLKRLIAHVESEQRISLNHEKRIDSNEKDVSWLKDSMKSIESSLRSLVLDVHSLKQKSGIWKDIVLIVSVVGNLVQIFLMK